MILTFNEYSIVISPKHSPQDKFAAETLQEYIGEMSGFKPEIKVSESSESKAFLIGEAAGCAECEKLGPEQFVIKLLNQNIHLYGEGKRGAIYAVVTFLEEICNCNFFAPDFKVIPKNEKIFVSDKLFIKQQPVFEQREPFWAPAFDTDFSVFNKANSLIVRKIPENMGGGVSYAGGMVHTFNNLVPPSVYFESHPEYFSMNAEGVRIKDGQLCLTNPDVLEITIQNVKKLIKENPLASIVSVSQNDTWGFCECPECKKIDDEEASHMGSILRFVNSVADAVKDDYPHIAIDTLAYLYSRTAPAITKPRKNVIIRLCSIECCFSHTLRDCKIAAIKHTTTSHKSFAEDIDDWAKICNRLYIWDYTTNFRHYLTPFPNFGVLQDNVKFFEEHNVKGLFEQGDFQNKKPGEFGELKGYLLAKLLWNPDLDFDVYMNKFLKNYYGKGWKSIRSYIDFIEMKSEGDHFNIYDMPTKILPLNSEDVSFCDHCWDEAEKEAADEAELRRIQRSRLQLEFYKFYANINTFCETEEELALKKEELYDKIYEFGVKHIREGGVRDTKPDFKAPLSVW